VLGPKPKKSPSYVNYPACDAEVAKIADEVWPATPGEHAFGRGKVSPPLGGGSVGCRSVAPGFAAAGVRAKLDFIHRALDGVDIYFVSNQNHLPGTVYFRSASPAACRNCGTHRPATFARTDVAS